MIGHVLRHESLLHDISEGRMKAKATRGRKRMHILSNLMKNRNYMKYKNSSGDEIANVNFYAVRP